MRSLFNKEVLYPWAGRPSIYETVKSQLNEEGRLRADTLPDDEEFWSGHSVRWVAGGLDGAFGHHAAGGKETAAVKEILQLLARQSRKPDGKSRRMTYLKLMETDVLGIIDPLLDHLRKHPGVNVPNLYDEAYWFAANGVHRSVVKFGIAMLGQFETENHRELILTLGKHDEFTLYAAVAAGHSLIDANEALFELAQCVDGWGKIQLVERLEPETAEIRDWLLRNGCRNNVMYEYLAYTCAVKGELHNALNADRVDDELYEGAGDILSALLAGGPAEDIDDYEHAPLVIGQYIRLSATRCRSLPELAVVIDIQEFLDRDDESWKDRYAKGWTEEMRLACRQTCREILADGVWPDKVWSEIRSGNDRSRRCAVRAARKLGLDLWPELFARLEQAPLSGALYFELMRTDDKERVLRLVALAERTLPLAAIASGPGQEMGIGPGFEPHGALDFIVQELNRYPGVGRQLIETALQSPVIRNRNMALGALEAWDPALWDDDLTARLTQAEEAEPDSNVRERIKMLLKEKRR